MLNLKFCCYMWSPQHVMLYSTQGLWVVTGQPRHLPLSFLSLLLFIGIINASVIRFSWAVHTWYQGPIHTWYQGPVHDSLNRIRTNSKGFENVDDPGLLFCARVQLVISWQKQQTGLSMFTQQLLNQLRNKRWVCC